MRGAESQGLKITYDYFKSLSEEELNEKDRFSFDRYARKDGRTLSKERRPVNDHWILVMRAESSLSVIVALWDLS